MSKWCDRAARKLAEEAGQVKGQKENAMKAAVKDALLEFCRQDEEFAQAVAQGKSFAECMAAVAKGVGSSITDLDAYKRAVKFYFDGAEVEVAMTIHLGPADTTGDRGNIVIDLSDFF